LAIEVDGYSHGTGDRPQRDEKRDAWLAARGIRTLRLRAQLVLSDMNVALATLRGALTDGPLHHPSGGPPPPTGEDFKPQT
jgi:very-short-patch-repair endonuclease